MTRDELNVALWSDLHLQRYGDYPSLASGGELLTSGFLHDRACRLATALIRVGVEPGDRVVLLLPAAAVQVIAIPAIWRCGAVVVSCNPASPDPELEGTFGHCEPKAVVVTAEHAGRVRCLVRPGVHVIVPGEEPTRPFEALVGGVEALTVPVPRAPSDAAQISYSSGTTGARKGIVYTHGGMNALLSAYHGFLAEDGSDRSSPVWMVAPSPTAFGTGYVPNRYADNRLLVLPDGTGADELLAAIDRYRVTDLVLVPTMYETILSFPTRDSFDISSVSRPRVLGAALSPTLAERIEDTFGASVIDAYGLTEAGGIVTHNMDGKPGSVGRPFPSAKLRIVGDDGGELPAGESGEIHVKTAWRAGGYYRDPDRTRAVFLDDGWLITGDRGYVDKEGYLYVVGRSKEIIIQGGYNVAPQEIVEILEEFPEVREAAVIGLPHSILGEEVVACVVRRDGASLSESEVLRACRQHLDPRKMPGQVRFLDELPRTVTGKVASHRLTQQVAELVAADTAARDDELIHALQRDEANPQAVRARLLAVVEEALAYVLGSDRAGAGDSRTPFGDRGVTSIEALRLARVLSDRLGVQLPAAATWTYPTAVALAEQLSVRFLGERQAPAAARVKQRTAEDERIAIVGISCRLPGGAGSPAAFWNLLRDGVDAVRPLPESRPGDFEQRPVGAFLDAVDQFDAAFFRLSLDPQRVDPQHRMLLEATWEALEDAGMDPFGAADGRTGMFVGIWRSEYGSPASMGCGHVGQFLDLRGPMAAIDTTCSSSLVAMHAAVQSLRAGECDACLAGGVYLFSGDDADPLAQFGVLAPDGRSKAFDARADGMGWGEGCGMLVLKRLSDAIRDGDRVWAVIRGTAVNHDGRSSSVTAPNPASQETVIRDALESGGVDPAAVQYVETHGTGTLLGDPIEVGALARVFGARTGAPLAIGSVKTNIGHLITAAGVAGVIKTILALAKRELPPSLHFHEPNPHIPWNEIPIRVQAERGRWPNQDAPLIAGVSSFGMSGTNAHIVLEEAPPAARQLDAAASGDGPCVLPVSARSEDALVARAEQYARVLEAGDVSVRDVVYTAGCRRAHLEHRIAVVGASGDELAARLRDAARGDTGPASHSGVASSERLAVLFCGQGSQWWGMGRQLYETEPVYRKTLDDIAERVHRWVPWNLLDELKRDEETSRLAETEIAQPALFAVQVALYELWRSWGVEPGAVCGHSVGEIAAAYAAGALTLDTSARLACERARIMEKATGLGLMAPVQMSAADAEAFLVDFPGVEVAVSNGPVSSVLSGDASALRRALDALDARGVKTKILENVKYPSHSAHMEGFGRELEQTLGFLDVQPMRVTLLSTVTAQPITNVDAAYWGAQVRKPVRFAEAVEGLLDAGYRLFLEIAPHPVLAPAAAQTIDASGTGARVAWSLRRDAPERETMLGGLAALYCDGYPVDWTAQHPDGGRVVELPAYPWQHRRFWSYRPARARSERAVDGERHPLVDTMHESASSARMSFSTTLSSRRPSWLGDHRVYGRAVVPGTAVLELCREALTRASLGEHEDVSELVLLAPMVVNAGAALEVQAEVSKNAEDELEVEVYSRPVEEEGDLPWTLHATCRGVSSDDSSRMELAPEWPEDGAELWTAEQYERIAEQGIAYGPSFRGVRSVVAAGADTWLARVELPDSERHDAELYGIHPALLDAALHASAAIGGGGGETMLPFSIGTLCLWKKGVSEVLVRIRRTQVSEERARLDVDLWDRQGAPVGFVGAVEARKASPSSLEQGRGAERDLYEVSWQAVASPARRTFSGQWVVVAEVGEGDAWRAALEEAGAQVTLVSPGTTPSGGIAGLVRVWSSAADPDASLRMVRDGLAELQASLAVSERPREHIWVTHNAVSSNASDDVSGLFQSPLLGLARSARAEYPEIALRCVDVDEDTPEAIASSLAISDEPELAIRGGELLAPRLVGVKRERLQIPDSECWRLEEAASGRLDELEFRAVPRVDVGAGELRVEVRASGLNFRDVLTALGMFPGETVPVGGELAGVVTEVGDGVEGLAVGDRVMGFGGPAFASEVVCDARLMVPIPETLSFVEAATVPIAYATAYFGMHDLARVERGERILIHAATGGVGMAALSLARLWGLDVLATASAPKWPVLSRLGFTEEQIASTRTLEFAEHFRERRPDVVLNSLAGEFIDASLGLLSAGGRFLEMGRTDLRSPAEVSRAHPGVSYHAFDLVDVEPERLGEVLRELSRLLQTGELAPIPHRSYAVEDARSVFRRMAQAKHVGKIVFEPSASPAVPKQGTVLVTGGLGALGRHTARWLAEQGCKHLVLMSRTAAHPDAGDVVGEIESLGATVEVVACDVSDRASLERALRAIPPEASLRGVVHCAGVLDDGVLTEQTAARFARVMKPKIWGAWHLHELTADAPLDLFVLYSSAASVTGPAGQSNYAASNAFLDALAHYRRARGLPAVSLSWGGWRGGGLAEGRADFAKALRLGYDSFAPQQGIAALSAALRDGSAHLVPWALRLSRLRRHLGGRESVPALWRVLVQPRARRRREVGFAELLAPLSPDERRNRLRGLVRAETAAVLSMPAASKVPWDQPLQELGLDSLMAVDLRNRLVAMTGLKLSTTFLFDYPTVGEVADTLVERLSPDDRDTLGVPDLLSTLAQAVARSSKKRLEELGLLSRLCELAGTKGAGARDDGSVSGVAEVTDFDNLDNEGLLDAAAATIAEMQELLGDEDR